MSFAALVRDMAAAGATAEAIAIAIEAIEARDAVAADRRAQAADRKRRQRERERDSHATVTGQSQDEPSLSLPPNENISTPPTHTHPDNISRTRKGGFLAPNGVTGEQWDAFVSQRKKRLNERSYTLVCNKLEKLAQDGWPPGELIDLAVERGWETVFAPTRQRGFSNGQQHHSDGLGPTARAAIEVFGHPDDDEWAEPKPVGRSQPRLEAGH